MRLLLLLAFFGFVAISLVSATPQRLKRQAPSEDDGEDDSTDVEPVEGEVPAVDPVPTEDGETDVDEPAAENSIPKGPAAEEPTETGCEKTKGGRRDGKKGGRRAPNGRSTRSRSGSRGTKSRGVSSRDRKSQKSSRGKRQ